LSYSEVDGNPSPGLGLERGPKLMRGLGVVNLATPGVTELINCVLVLNEEDGRPLTVASGILNPSPRLAVDPPLIIFSASNSSSPLLNLVSARG
jgi:hypothetical protein